MINKQIQDLEKVLNYKTHKHKFYPFKESDRDIGTSFARVRIQYIIVFACECGITKEVDMRNIKGKLIKQYD